MENKTYRLLVTNTHRARKDSRYDASRMTRSHIGSVNATYILGRMPIYPQDGSPCVTVDPKSCRCNGKLTRWRLRLLEYDFEIVYRADVKHQAAGALFRLCTTGVDYTELEEEIPVMVETRMKICNEKNSAYRIG